MLYSWQTKPESNNYATAKIIDSVNALIIFSFNTYSNTLTSKEMKTDYGVSIKYNANIQ